MENFKKFLTLTLCVMLVFAFASCGNTAPAEEEGQEGDPLALVNIEDNGDVTFHCTVNGDWLTGNEAGNVTTRHFIVAEDGFNKGKSVLSGLAPARDIYEAMMEAGFEAGKRNEEVFKLAKGETLSEGEKINITLTWEGQEDPVDINDCLVLDNGKSPDLEIYFHGNHANFEKNYSGCVTCLDSCYVGLTSNAKYGFLDVEKNNPNILGNSKVFPEDGTVVQVIFSKAK